MEVIDKRETSKALFKNTGIIAIGQISTRVVNFFLLPLYTALLTTEEYGFVDLLTTYSGLLVVLIGLQMHQAIFRFLVTKRNDKDAIKQTVSSIICCIIVIFVAYILIFMLISPVLKLSCKWFLVAHVLCSISLQTVSGIARGLGKNADYACGNFVSSSTILILNVVLIAGFRLGVSAMLISYIIGPILGTILLFFKCRIYAYFSVSDFKKEELRKVLEYSVPLVPNELSWSVIHSSDRWIVSAVLTVAANGLIAVASKFSLMYTTFFSIFNASWTEQVVLHYKDKGGPQYVNEMFNKLVVFFATLAIGIISVMPFLFKYLVNKQFKDAYYLIPLYMIAVFFNAVIGMLSAIYLIENETKQVALSTMVAAFINIVVDLVLIRIVGVYAAPISSICGYATISVWRLVDVNRRHCKIGISLKNVVMLIILLALAIFTYVVNTSLLKCVGLIAVIILSIFVNRIFLKELLALIRRNE